MLRTIEFNMLNGGRSMPEKVLAQPIDFDALMDFCKSEAPVKGDFILEGFVATSELDLQDDRIAPEALKAAEKDLEKNSTVLDNHDPNKRVGRVLLSELRPGGLFVRVRISETVPHIRKQIEEGILNKFSIRGKIIDAEPRIDAETGRVFTWIQKIYLIHASVVSVPANTGAESLRWYVVKSYLNATGGENMDKKDEKKDETTSPEKIGEASTETAEKAAPSDQTGAKTTEAQKESKSEAEKTNIPGVQALLDEIKTKAPAVADLVTKIMELIAKAPAAAASAASSTSNAAKSETKTETKPDPKPETAVKSEGEEKKMEAPPAIAPELEKAIGDVVKCLTGLGERMGKLEKMAIPISVRKSHIDTETKKGENGAGDKTRPIMDRLRDAVGGILKPEVR